ncbi:MAG: AI-2E family transporter [Bacteriovoracaceae bacterium]
MFGLVALAIFALFFILAPHAAFLIFGGILVSLILLGIADAVKKKVPTSKRKLLGFTIAGFFLLAIGGVWLISSRLAQEMSTFSETMPKAIDNLITYIKQYDWINRAIEQAKQDDWVGNIAPQLLPKTAKIASVALNGVVAFAVALFLGVYFAIDSKKYGEILIKIAPKKEETKYHRLFEALYQNLQSWLMGQLFSMFAIFVLAYIGLLILGVKAALPLAAIAGLLTFIPNVGPIIASVLAMIMAFPEGLKMVAYVAILYMIVEALEGMLITPLIQKHKVSALPGALISFQFIMAILFGFPGLFLATPFLVAMMTLVDKLWIENPQAAGKTSAWMSPKPAAFQNVDYRQSRGESPGAQEPL